LLTLPNTDESYIHLDKRKRKNQELMRALFNHRDDFMKFHKNKRIEQAKLLKSIRAYVESMENKRERDEARSEAKRLQALRENDMESYMQLVSETKNKRLQYLLNETDSYIATINRMIQEQRQQSNPTYAPPPSIANATAAATAINTTAASSYMSSTHRVAETVSQPMMLQGGDLKEYQLSGVQWLVSLYNNNLNGILADEMGLGKTIQTIALLAYLMESKHNFGPFMIVCPLSTISNWTNEIQKWAPDMINVVYKGVPSARKQIYKEEVESGKFNILLTTYEYVMKDKSFLSKLFWQYIIVDEGHRMKNSHSKFASILGQKYSSRHRILLTGTPLQNNLPELWSLLNFLLPTIFNSVDTFDQWFNKPFQSFRQNNADSNDNSESSVLTQEEKMLIIYRLHEVLRPFVLRRVKSQVLDQLPEKVERVIRCEFSGWQKQLYEVIYEKSMTGKDVKEFWNLDEEKGTQGGVNNVWMQLRKVCNHPYLFLNDYILDDDLIRSSGILSYPVIEF
jgi:ATP-dependent helicase STH1/SNF2